MNTLHKALPFATSAAACLLLSILNDPAPAKWSTVAQYWPPDMPDSTMQWFEQQRSSNGHCCAVADGYPAEWKRDGEKYFVFDEISQIQFPYETKLDSPPPHPSPEWREVPKEALILNSKNPTGRAVVWYMASRTPEGWRGIRCFIAGAEG